MMGCTVQEMSQRMTAQEFGAWQVYLAHEPAPAMVLPLLLAQLLTALANGPLKAPHGAACWQPRHFLPPDPWAEPEPPPSEGTFEDFVAHANRTTH